MRKTVLYIAMSLDGYIARENGDIDWLEDAEGEGDNGYSELMKNIDTVIMGRKTYEQVLGFDMEFPYKGMDCYIYSNEKDGRDEYASFVKGSPISLISELKKQPGKDIWLIGGGEIIREFLKDQLVDQFMIAVIPILLGKGIPLFRKDFPEHKLTLANTQIYNEIVMLSYDKKQ